jgi:hypothetical protein
MFCYTRNQAMNHYDPIINIITTALQASYYVPDKNEDADLHEYFRTLREHLLECITCIIHCLKDINLMDKFSNNVASILEFCEKIIEDKYEPTIVNN